MVDLILSAVSLVSLLVILLEARGSQGLLSRWLVRVWAGVLLAVAGSTVAKLVKYAPIWPNGRVFMVVFAVANFLIAVLLLFAWLYWTRPPSTRG